MGYTLTIDEKKYQSEDPILTGRQLLELAGKTPVVEHIILELGDQRQLEDIDLEETVDLREPGRERFLTFRGDRLFNFELDGQRQPWGAESISETMLRRIAGTGDSSSVWLERRDEKDLQLQPGQQVSLDNKGVERFYIDPNCSVTIIVEGTPYQWARPRITYEEVVTLYDPDFPQHPEINYSVTYDHGPRQNHEGILSPGGVVKIKKRMVFHVSRTGQS